jgi:hypothetical protein
MPEHTPGPFPLKVTKVDDFFVIVTNQGNHYAKTFDPAAARLIATAPELLEALKWALEQIADDLNPDHQEAFDAAFAVASRAGGYL